VYVPVPQRDPDWVAEPVQAQVVETPAAMAVALYGQAATVDDVVGAGLGGAEVPDDDGPAEVPNW
jgi:hypothetical protein